MIKDGQISGIPRLGPVWAANIVNKKLHFVFHDLNGNRFRHIDIKASYITLRACQFFFLG